MRTGAGRPKSNVAPRISSVLHFGVGHHGRVLRGVGILAVSRGARADLRRRVAGIGGVGRRSRVLRRGLPAQDEGSVVMSSLLVVACAVCFGQSDSPLAQGTNMGESLCPK